MIPSNSIPIRQSGSHPASGSACLVANMPFFRPVRVQEEMPQAPSPFEDYQEFPFHWTGESMSTIPVTQSPSANRQRAALIAQFPMLHSSQLEDPQPSRTAEPDKSVPRKRRFRQLRRAMSLTHIRHKPTPPDTAPPTPTLPTQVPSSIGVKSIESLAHWQLPDPTAAPTSLDANLLIWPPSLLVRSTRPSDQLSPPSSIPSESDILPPDGLDMELDRNSRASEAFSLSPRTLYPPALYDSINLGDPHVLEKGPTGKVIAGTVEGLVAYITSPDCLDYEVLSDFFMMYRKFMDPSKLLGLLFARYEWGLIRGAVVRPPDNEGISCFPISTYIQVWSV
jgi:RasGEF N-terminal motif